MKQSNNNYARCPLTGGYVFFNDATAPTFASPETWVFYRVPAGEDAETFRGQLVGTNPDAALKVRASDPESPASAAS